MNACIVSVDNVVFDLLHCRFAHLFYFQFRFVCFLNLRVATIRGHLAAAVPPSGSFYLLICCTASVGKGDGDLLKDQSERELDIVSHA